MSAAVQIVRWQTLRAWTPPVAELQSARWPMVPLGEILEPIPAIAYEPHRGEVLRFAGVRWYGNGVFVREERDADKHKAKCFRLVPGALVYNRLFGWKSAFAIVPDEMLGVVVSNEFPQLRVREELASPAFVQLVCGSPSFATVMLSRSTGTTAVSRNRLHVDDLLDLSIPLPDLASQDEITARVHSRRIRAHQDRARARTLREAARAEFEAALGFRQEPGQQATAMVSVARFAALRRWDVEASEGPTSGDWLMEPLGEHASVRLGCQRPKKGTAKTGVARPYLRAANVQRGWVSLADVNEMTVPATVAESLRLEPDDLLFVEGNSQSEVGRAAIWEHSDDTIFQNSVIRARTHETLDSRFACAWFNTAPGRAYFQEHATTTSGTLWHIGAGKTAAAPVPVAPIETQRALADAYWMKWHEADALAARAAETDEETTRWFAEVVFEGIEVGDAASPRSFDD